MVIMIGKVLKLGNYLLFRYNTIYINVIPRPYTSFFS